MKNLVGVKGMKLHDALTKFKEQLRNKRVLYVLEPNMEKGDIVKFGIAGMDSGNSFSRLKQYDITYGKEDTKNKCKGVWLWFLGTTNYNRLVEAKNSKVFKMEKKLKQDLNSQTETGVDGRGTERTNKRPDEILRRIKELEPKIEDVKTIITREAREKTKKYRDDEKAYIDSVTPRKSKRNLKK